MSFKASHVLHQVKVLACSVHCALLSLPSEIRNYIWELVFFREPTNEIKSYNLLRTYGVHNSLLVACRQTYKETIEWFKDAHDDFWTYNSFCIDADVQEPQCHKVRKKIAKLRDWDLDKIRRLHMRKNEFGFEYRDGMWTCIGDGCKGNGDRWHSSCPSNTIVYDPPDDALTSVPGVELLSKRYHIDHEDSDRFFVAQEVFCGQNEYDEEAAKRAIGYRGLTKDELLKVFDLYQYTRTPGTNWAGVFHGM